ncbi:hypothetical protein [Tomitella biformata]|uniref:hypothetical protein n=1 Tax=Tomitella biformata TaxID=630403 RepID=UPI00046431C3|nr:hypothetical protein [Tomitella biformata]
MFWKVLGAIVLVWLVFVLLGWIIKGLFWMITIGVIAVGIYILYKAMTSDSKESQHR